MKNKGFTLIELLVSLAIFSIIIGLTFPAFRNILTASKTETASEEAHIDKIISLELMRLDLENANYGIAKDEANVPMTWDNAGKVLQLNSTLNNTNQATIGWMMYDCTAGGTLSSNVQQDKRQLTTNNNIVLLDSDKNFESLTTTGAGCPATNGIYLAYPYDNSPGTNACATQWCSKVQYKLSATNPLADCAAGTKNLLRAVGTGAGDPILSCVADFTVTFGLDTTGNGIIDTPKATALPATTSEILNQVKNIDLYALVQFGKKDQNLSSNENLVLDTTSGITLSKANVTEDPSKYRWKVVRISGKPMSW